MAEEPDKKGIQWNYETLREKYDESRMRAKAKVRTEYKHLDRELNNIPELKLDNILGSASAMPRRIRLLLKQGDRETHHHRWFLRKWYSRAA